MQTVTAVRYSVLNGFLFGILMLSGVQAVQAQTAEEILAKAGDAYAAMKTHQAVYRMDITVGTLGSYSMTVDSKSVGDKKRAVKFKYDGNGSERMAAIASSVGWEMIDDGVNIYRYYPARNTYIKTPHNDAGAVGANALQSGVSNLVSELKPQKDFTYKLLAAAKVDEKDAYVIEATGTEEREKTLFIDKMTYHLLQMKSITPTQGQTITATLTLKSEMMNAPIPDSTFVFVVPKGAREMGNLQIGPATSLHPGNK